MRIPEDVTEEEFDGIEDALMGKQPEGPEYRPDELAPAVDGVEVDSPLPPEPAKAPNAATRLAVGPVGKSPPMDDDYWTGVHAKLKAAGANHGNPSKAPAASSKEPDWMGIQRSLGLAKLNDDMSRSADQGFSNIGPGKYKSDPGGHESATAIARLPLEMAGKKQDYDVKQSKLGIDAAKRDPNSLQSQKAREAFKAFVPGAKLPPGFDNWSAEDVLEFGKKATTHTGDITAYQSEQMKRQAVEDERRRAKEEAARLQHEKERGEDLEGRKQSHEDSLGMQRATLALAGRAADRADNPKLPTGQVAELSDYETAGRQVDDLFAEFDKGDQTGIGSRLKGKISDATGADLGDTSRYVDKANATAQVVGLILEGGKLGEADLPRYRAMMPNPGDSRERAAAKVANIKKLLGDKARDRKAAYGAAGYKTPAPKRGSGRLMRDKDGNVFEVVE